MHDETMPRLPDNIGTWDRVFRIALGLALFGLGLSGLFDETMGAALRLASLIPLAMGGLGWCPVYDALGFTTNRKSKPAGPLHANESLPVGAR